MYSYISKHPRTVAALILLLGYALSLLDIVPRLHNDDMQHVFLICNGGVGESVPFGLYNNVIFGAAIQWLLATFPGVNVYLLCLTLVTLLAVGTMNEFVLRHRAAQPEGPWAKPFTFITVLMLIYINWTCLGDQQIQYTHTSILAGASASMILFDIFCGYGGWKRLSLGLLLFLSMYILRPEAIMAFVMLAGGAVASSFVVNKSLFVSRSARLLAAGMLALLALCVLCDHVAYQQNEEWNDALTYRKQRVRIQDFPDNSEVDKSQALTDAGISPEEFAIFKRFIYVPSMDDMKKIEDARDIHIAHNKGLWGIEKAARVGLLPPTREKWIKPFTDLVYLTPWFPFLMAIALFAFFANRTSARAVVPALLATLGYIILLLLSGRCTGRVAYPALFFGAAWIWAFLPSDARLGQYRIIRWGTLGAGILCFAICMRHYRVHLSNIFSPNTQAADICRSHPENIYLAATWQAGPAYRSGITGCTRKDWEETNVIPIADGWIFYTPAYRAFLKQRGIADPYALLTQPNVYVLIKDYDGLHYPPMLRYISRVHAMNSGKEELQFRCLQSTNAISFWQAIVPEAKERASGNSIP